MDGNDAKLATFWCWLLLRGWNSSSCCCCWLEAEWRVKKKSLVCGECCLSAAGCAALMVEWRQSEKSKKAKRIFSSLRNSS